jgi:hypothetical protein
VIGITVGILNVSKQGGGEEIGSNLHRHYIQLVNILILPKILNHYQSTTVLIIVSILTL